MASEVHFFFFFSFYSAWTVLQLLELWNRLFRFYFWVFCVNFESPNRLQLGCVDWIGLDLIEICRLLCFYFQSSSAT